MKGRAVSAPAAAASMASAGPPVLPPPLKHNYYARYAAEIAEAYLLVKYAVRYKGADETLGLRAWPLGGAVAAEVLEGEVLVLEEAKVTTSAPAGLRFSDLPDWLAAGGAKALEKAIRDRLADKLAATIYTDPVSRQSSDPGETRDAFAARLAKDGVGAEAEKLRDKLDRKKRELAMREQDLSGRKGEKWMAIGAAVLQNIAIFTGKKRTITGAGTVLTKNRMEDNAEARVSALKAEVAELEQELASLTAVDPSRFEEESLVPARTAAKVLRYDVLWVY
jgi:hypothetical protein